MDSEPVFVFHHIPKTAGTSVRTALYNAFGDKNCIHITDLDYLTTAQTAAAVVRGEHARLVCGHVPVRYVPREWRDGAITFLRDPIERVLSLYRFMAAQPEAQWRHTGLQPNFTLRDFLDCQHSDVVTQIDNAMCRFLAYEDGCWPIDDAAWYEFRPSAMTLYSALDALEAITFGICERMQDSLALISAEWNLPCALTTTDENKSPKNAAAAFAADIAEIAARNALDIALYRTALARFMLALKCPIPGKSPVTPCVIHPGRDYSVADLPARSGFHTFEPTANLSWLAGQTASLAFRCDDRPFKALSLRIYAGTHGYPVERVWFQLNGERVSSTWRADEDGEWGTAFIEPIEPRQGLNVIEICAPPPAEATGETLDPRTLTIGVAAVRAR